MGQVAQSQLREMQYSIFKPHEVEGQNDLYIRSNLETDYKFAERILDERSILLPKQVKESIDETHGVLHSLWFYTAGRRWWLITSWVIEMIFVLYLVVGFTFEAALHCPLEMGVTPYCEKCYDDQFLIFGFLWTLFWLANLWTYVCLISRGFSWRIQNLGQTVKINRTRGIPGIAVYFWFFTCIFNVVWLAVGIYLLVRSGSCDVNEHHHVFHGQALRGEGLRSDWMYWNLWSSLVAYVLLFAVGRVANWGQRKVGGEAAEDNK